MCESFLEKKKNAYFLMIFDDSLQPQEGALHQAKTLEFPQERTRHPQILSRYQQYPPQHQCLGQKSRHSLPVGRIPANRVARISSNSGERATEILTATTNGSPTEQVKAFPTTNQKLDAERTLQNPQRQASVSKTRGQR